MFKIEKVTSLPGVLNPSSLYLVLANAADTVAEAYITDNSGVAKGIGNTAFITAVATQVFNAQNASDNSFEIAADIPARDTLSAGFGGNRLVLVTDASDDPTVVGGSALYAWDDANSSFSKLTEFESLDVTLTWASITGGPSSSPAAIDTAVAATVANSAVISANTAAIGSNDTDIAANTAAITSNNTDIAANTVLATHANRVQIDKISESSGVPTYDGDEVYTSGATDW